MTMTMDERHLTDAELMRILDDEALPDGSDRIGHLQACDRCADALEQLRSGSRLITLWLERAAFEEAPADGARREGAAAADTGARARPAGAAGTRAAGDPGAKAGSGATGAAGDPTRSGRRGRARGTPSHQAGARSSAWLRSPWLKAAAVLVLVAGPLAAFPGVRAWVVEQVSGPADPGTAGTAPEATDPPMVLRFTPDPGAFTVRFPLGATGSIAVERSTDARAELEARGGDPEAVVAASSLEIRNEGEGLYRLRLPATVTGVWVRVGERAVAVTGAQIDRRTVVDLGPRFSQPAR